MADASNPLDLAERKRQLSLALRAILYHSPGYRTSAMPLTSPE
jgi:hypothetical protein